MSIKYLYAGSDQTDSTVVVKRIKGQPSGLTKAADGTFATSGVQILDPDGALDYLQLQTFAVEETTAAAPRLYTGRIFGLTVSRGPFKTGGGRVYDFEVDDLNGLLHMQPLRGSGAKRPQESADARLAWLMSYATGLSGLVFDNGLIGSRPQVFDAEDFRHKYPDDVLASITNGWIFYVTWVSSAAAGEEPTLFYNSPTAAVRDSTLRLSNVPADIDDIDDPAAVTFGVHPDPQLKGRGDTIYCGVDYTFLGGQNIYVHSDTTHATFFGTSDVHRVLAVESTRVGKLSTATTEANNFLIDHSGQLDEISCVVKLPANKVDLIAEGMRLQVKFAHFPGYESFTWTRVTKWTLLPFDQTSAYFDIQLTLSTKGIRGIGGGTPGDFPHPPPSPPALVQHKYDVGGSRSTVTLDAAPTEGNLLVCWATVRGNHPFTVTPAGWTAHPGGQVQVGGGINIDFARMIYRVVGAGESATVTVRDPATEAGEVRGITLAEFTGVTVTADADSEHEVSTSTLPATVNAGTITPTSGQSVLLVAGLAVGVSDYPSDVHSFITPGSGFTELEDHMTDQSGSGENFHPLHWFGYRLVDPTSGSYATAQTLGGGTLNYIGDGGQALAFVSLGDTNGPPLPAQWVPWAVVVMTGSTGTTADPYAAGSLLVKVDGVQISSASYTETDPTTGAFTLSWTPDTDETVTVSYQGAP